MLSASNQLTLAHGLSFEDLYSYQGLGRLDQHFLADLAGTDAGLHARLLAARANSAALAPKERSELIIALAPHFEDFLGELFGIVQDLRALEARHNQFAPSLAFKRKFIQKKAISGVTKEQAAATDGHRLALELEALFGEPLTEKSFVAHVSRWLDAEPENTEKIQKASSYAAWAALSTEGRKKHHRDVLFKVAHKLDPMHLI